MTDAVLELYGSVLAEARAEAEHASAPLPRVATRRA
jgi:hypothetical protein